MRDQKPASAAGLAFQFMSSIKTFASPSGTPRSYLPLALDLDMRVKSDSQTVRQSDHSTIRQFSAAPSLVSTNNYIFK